MFVEVVCKGSIRLLVKEQRVKGIKRQEKSKLNKQHPCLYACIWRITTLVYLG